MSRKLEQLKERRGVLLFELRIGREELQSVEKEIARIESATHKDEIRRAVKAGRPLYLSGAWAGGPPRGSKVKGVRTGTKWVLIEWRGLRWDVRFKTVSCRPVEVSNVQKAFDKAIGKVLTEVGA